MSGVEQEVDLSGEVTFEEADGLEFGVAIGGLLGYLGLSLRVQAEAICTLLEDGQRGGPGCGARRRYCDAVICTVTNVPCLGSHCGYGSALRATAAA